MNLIVEQITNPKIEEKEDSRLLIETPMKLSIEGIFKTPMIVVPIITNATCLKCKREE